MKAIVVFGWNRPEFLYTTLQGVYRMDGISEIPVYVVIDGGIANNTRLLTQELLKDFKIERLCFHEIHKNTLLSVTEGLNWVFRQGKDEIAFIEDDLLVRKDMILFWDSMVHKDETFTSIAGTSGKSSVSFRSIGNIIRKDKFESIYRFIIDKQYIGGYSHSRNLRFDDTNSHKLYDAVYDYYMRVTLSTTTYSDKPYVFHYGIIGTNNHFSTIARTVYNQIYNDSKDRWFDNLMAFVRKKEFDKSLPFVPLSFEVL